jgi:predicted HTH domain antitoxin
MHFTPWRQEVLKVNTAQYIPKTELARKTRQVINSVLRGQPAVVESYGQPEVAIIDIVDYYILRAVMRYYAHQPEINPEAGLPDQEVEAISDPQERFDLVLAHYLAEAISLGRAAELLDLSWLDLRTRCLRLDVPLRAGPIDVDEARSDVEVAEAWAAVSQP